MDVLGVWAKYGSKNERDPMVTVIALRKAASSLHSTFRSSTSRVYWWRTLHQPPSLMKPGPANIPPVIIAALLVNVVAFTLLCAYFVAKRLSWLRLEEEALA